jgi:hypothetical protein
VFAFSIGLLLPAPSDGIDVLSQRLEALRDLDFELRQRLAVLQPEMSLLIWWHNPSGTEIPAGLQDQLEALAQSYPGIWVENVERLPGSLQRWLLTSQMVIQITLPSQLDSHQNSNLLLERRLTHSRGGLSTLVQQLHADADQSARWLHFKGPWPLKAEQEHHPLRELQGTLADFGATIPGRRNLQLTSSEALRTQQAEAWARSKAQHQLSRSNMRLWLQACGLALLLVGMRQLLPRLAPALLLLIIGVWLLSRQPLRQKAQHWWSAADGLWVQDLWQRFGVDEAPADWLESGQLSERRPDHDALVGLLVSHQLWLWLQPPGSAWRGSQLVDAAESLRVRHELLYASLQRHMLIRQMITLLLAVMGAGMVAILLLPWIWLEQLELLLAVAVAALHLGTPLPLVDAARLSQHQARLERARQELLAAQIQDVPSYDPVLRESVGLWIRRVGAEVLDLCADGLRSAASRRRWLP